MGPILSRRFLTGCNDDHFTILGIYQENRRNKRSSIAYVGNDKFVYVFTDKKG